MEKKLQEVYPTYYNSLIARQTYYQILSIIFLQEFIKLNVNTDMVIKNVKLVKLNINIETVKYCKL